jgi:hypothetical protein
MSGLCWCEPLALRRRGPARYLSETVFGRKGLGIVPAPIVSGAFCKRTNRDLLTRRERVIRPEEKHLGVLGAIFMVV